MRPVAPSDRIQDLCFSSPSDEDAPLHDDTGVPLAAFSQMPCFWDHLGATRADEYAQEGILPDSALPQPQEFSALYPDDQSVPYEALDMTGIRRASLDDTLQAHEVGALQEASVGGERAASSSISAISAAHGVALPEEYIPSVDLFPGGAMPPVRPKRLRRRTLRDSRVGYRLQRIWLTPGYRRFIKFGMPVLGVLVAIGFFFSDETRRQAVSGQIEMAYDAFVDRPEFMISTLQLPEVSPELDHALREKMDVDLPQSSFRLDLDALRLEVETLDWVRSADLRLLSDGVLALSVTERIPAVLWRSENGLEILDAEGVRVALAAGRDVRPDLPLIAGRGADAQIPEALDLLDAATPLGERLRGLIRMGERRWDVVLDREQRIRLPETGAIAALERVIALEQAQDLLSRDLLAADLRNPARPVLQISEGAMETIREIRSQKMEALQ